MSHHYVQQLVHVVWSTANQQHTLPDTKRNQLYAYLSTVIKSKGAKLYIAGGTHDHIHCLISLPSTLCMSAFMREIKVYSSKWLKQQPNLDSKFAWEDGYSVVSIQNDRVNAVCTYIKGEENRHKTESYKDELLKLLQLQNISYNEEYFLKNTHAKILLHLIWATKNRAGVLNKEIRPSLYREMSHAVTKTGGAVHAIGGVEDHVHILIEASRTVALADGIKEIKDACSRFLSSMNNFEWQTGYGAFSISYSTLEHVKQYIFRQEEHHKEISYADEWNEFLLKRGLLSIK